MVSLKSKLAFRRSTLSRVALVPLAVAVLASCTDAVRPIGTAVRPELPLVLIYLGGILWLSATPARDLARLGLSASTLDLVHIPLFVGLTWVTLWSLGGPPGVRVALAACLGFAAVGEWLKASVPGRVASLADLRANAAGVLIGIAVFEGVLLWARKRERL